MLHNHLRNFTSHKLVVDLDASDQTYNGTNSVDQLRPWIKIRRNHVRRIIDPSQSVAALCEG